MGIELVKVRAEVKIGGGNSISTPFVQSFNVRKARNQSSTFDASLKVDHYELAGSNVGGEIEIRAGANGSLNLIFTGIIKKITVSPCWDDPGYVLLNLSGTDALSLLAGKKYTRRCRATRGTWVGITGVVRQGLRDGKFKYETDNVSINSDMILPSDSEETTWTWFTPGATAPNSTKNVVIGTQVYQDDKEKYISTQ